jgi:hypothetical protein
MLLIQKFHYRSSRKIEPYFINSFNPWENFRIKWQEIFGGINQGPRGVLYFPLYFYSKSRKNNDVFLVWYEKPTARVLPIFENFFDSSTGYELFMIRKYKCYALNCLKFSDYKTQRDLFIQKIKNKFNKKMSKSYINLSLKTPILLNKNLKHFLLFQMRTLPNEDLQIGKQKEAEKNLINFFDIKNESGLDYFINLLRNGKMNYTTLREEYIHDNLQIGNTIKDFDIMLKDESFKLCLFKNLYKHKNELKLRIYRFKNRNYLIINIPIPLSFLYNHLGFASILFNLSVFQIPLSIPFRLGLGIIELSKISNK